ncbi:MAG: glycosyltransferase family 2 protein [Bacteroidetes bacterium]|uniref:Glycosyltransferase family 2 protein n=1 Tax=Candidatus Cryptobacteroides intestinigallinarum TaxID=2840767 RepID=A0A9D9MZK1_9BACT|nr:glycosyltransferase family 2 protein [Candidatus Cryptobacteroides intestinigallinarum]
MHTLPEITIIVPVFNAEKTLCRCVESVLGRQSMDWELILVDDGSTDASPGICDEFASRDRRIRVFHKPNGGVSSARNVGLDNASGRMIVFADSDDVIHPEVLHPDCCKADLVICSFSEAKPGGTPWFTRFDDSLLCGQEMTDFIRERHYTTVLKVVWGKVFRRKLVGDLRFDERIPLGEDFLFLLTYLERIRSLALSSGLLYEYTQSEISIGDKYPLSADLSAYIMRRLYDAYEGLGIRSDRFEAWLFFDHRMLCRRAATENPSAWYRNSDVAYVFPRVRHALSRGYMIRYRLLSLKPVAMLHKMFSRDLR